MTAKSLMTAPRYLKADDLPEPYGPDPVVFGAPKPRHTPGEALALVIAAPAATYRCCDVQGAEAACWCCGRPWSTP